MCVCRGVCVCACGEVSPGSTTEEQSVKRSRSGSVDKLSTKGSSTRTHAAEAHGTSPGEQRPGLSHRSAEKHPNAAGQGKAACVLPPETAFINESPRSLRDQERRGEGERG